MQSIFFSPYIVPLGSFLVGISYLGFSAWGKARTAELAHDREMRLKEMEHQRQLKEMDLELARLQGAK